jgi:hypothetical protein
MAAPTTPVDANGNLLVVGNNAVVRGKILSITSGSVVIEVEDAYATVEASRTQITVPSYNVRTSSASPTSS